jgi:hypothetical protein
MLLFLKKLMFEMLPTLEPLKSISPKFYEKSLCQIPFVKNYKLKLQVHKSCTKHKTARKYWWNWYLGSISPTCLPAAFICEDSKSAKRKSSHQYFLPFWVSAHKKAARKTIVKLIPFGVRRTGVVRTLILRQFLKIGLLADVALWLRLSYHAVTFPAKNVHLLGAHALVKKSRVKIFVLFCFAFFFSKFVTILLFQVQRRKEESLTAIHNVGVYYFFIVKHFF